MPVSLNRLSEGWLELESDPGLFSLLLEDFGVKGVQVEEIYDIQKSMDGPVFGFIFLFKWIEERRSRRKMVFGEEGFVQDETAVNSIFFAHQIVPNSCATHSLLSVLLNCEGMFLGETLTRLKDYTLNMTPENKGYAIGNTPELARAHNSHAKAEPKLIQEKPHGFPTSRIVEAFHFVSFVPIKGRLFELDGLKPYPIDHGEWGPNEDWTEKFRRVITERLGISNVGEACHDIRFNLMAVVPDRKLAYEQKLKTLKINRQIVLEALQQLVKVTKPKLSGENSQEKSNEVSQLCELGSERQTNFSSSVLTKVAPVSRSTSTSSNSSASSYSSIHPALDGHNYAKSPLTESQLDDTDARLRDDDEDVHPVSSSASGNIPPPPPKLMQTSPGSSSSWSVAANTTSPIPLRPIMVSTKDFSKPLSIQTKFETSPTPSCSSTDTSSEVGSAFNSPVRPLFLNSSQSSPNAKEFKRFVVIRVSGSKDHSTPEQSPDQASTSGAAGGVEENRPISISSLNSNSSSCCSNSRGNSPKKLLSEMGNEAIPASKSINQKQLQPSPKQEVSSSTNETAQTNSASTSTELRPSVPTGTVHIPPPFAFSPHSQSKESPKYLPLIEPHTFAPKDLLALLKNIENEISVCEGALKDEVEKQRKYKIDDCRRTHNYDNFISTFISLLDQQGMLKDLIEQHVVIKRRQGINVGRLHKAKKAPEKKRKPRSRKKK
ncbi:hypothetical protein CHUAL_002771 [Chamberlinius hualienensis]